MCSFVYMAERSCFILETLQMETVESVGTHVQQGGLHHLSQLLDLLLTSTYITVGHIRLLLHLQYHIFDKESLLQLERFLASITAASSSFFKSLSKTFIRKSNKLQQYFL